jgi:hypothetical protein
VRWLAVALDATALLCVMPLMRRAHRQSAITAPAES